MSPSKIKAAVIGSGNIGTDLVIKLKRVSQDLEVVALVGIDPESDGLARARRLGLETTSDGVRGLIALPSFPDIDIVFDATSAGAHAANWAALEPHGKRMIDLTPAAIGPFVVPVVNLDAVASHRNVNMVTCGGQATVPIVAAVNAVSPVLYGEIVASISSRSAGPGTRANIDEFTETTSHAIVAVGGAKKGKAIIVLNPAEPPLLMRDTVLCVTEELHDEARRAVVDSVATTVERVAAYVPGYRLKQEVHFRTLAVDGALGGLLGREPGGSVSQVSVFLEVEGAGHYLPPYAGNLDIMTSAAVRVGDAVARQLQTERVAS
jgi:acetaldehyde dehydrogenase